MTAFTTVSNALVAVGAKPFATTVQALRDNPIAIGEGDATVPLGLLPTVFLGTLTTNSGASQTLPSLVLTPYKFIRAVFNGVSASLAGSFTLGGGTLITGTSPGSSYIGMFDFDLASPVFLGGISANATVVPQTGSHTLTTASTSIVVSTSAGVWDAGSIRIYGMK